MASTNGENTVLKNKFPQIVLDTTLAELLAEESDWKITESLCNIKPCADPRHKTVPRNKKYLMTSSQVDDSDDLAHLQLENVSYLLSFWAGHMEVSLMACEGNSNDDTLTKETITQNALKAFSILDEKQRPWPSTFTNKTDFIQHHGPSPTRVRWGFAVDFAEQIPSFVHPEQQYKLNAKRWLAECSLRSANDRIIDLECKCSDHTTADGFWYHEPGCSTCEIELTEELDRLRNILQDREVPYVLKITQALGSVGTMLVRTEEDRKKTIQRIIEVQRESLAYVTKENAHIYPVSLIMSDFLPGITNALNFYVRRDASVKFLGACHQLSTRITEGGRQCTALAWDDQEKLERKFRQSLDEIGKVLHDEGYFGPCGADIMETEDGTQYVIDLNVRTATSLVLGCLRGHCEKRKFNACAVYECLMLRLSREALEDKFEKEFEEGRIILLGNTRLGKKNIWAYPVVLAGENQNCVKELGARLLKHDATTADGADAGGA